MKDTSKEKIVLLTLIDNSQIEGVLIKIDKENLKIILGKGMLTQVDGKTESFEKTEIFKKDIREIRIVEEKDKPKESVLSTTSTSTNQGGEIKTVVPSKEDKKIENTNSNSTFNAIPQDIQDKYINSATKYDKGDFFDSLVISTNKENYKEVKTYNERNKETFGIDDTREVNGNRRGRKKRYNNNHGGGFNQRGGFGYNNYNNNFNSNHYNSNSGYNNYSSYNQNNYKHNNNNNNNNNNYNNYHQGRGGFGGGRGGYSNTNSSSQYGVKSDMSIYSNSIGGEGNNNSGNNN